MIDPDEALTRALETKGNQAEFLAQFAPKEEEKVAEEQPTPKAA